MPSEPRSRIARLLLFQAILNTATSIAGIFSLIFLVNSGLTYQQVLVYLLAAVGTAALLCLLLSGKGWMGARASISAAMLFLGSSYGAFLVFEGYLLAVIPGILFGFYMAFFWIPFNALIFKVTRRFNRGFFIGISFLIPPVILLFIPILGGAIIERMNFGMIFIIAFILLSINAVIAIASRDLLKGKVKVGMSIKSMGKRLGIAFFLEGMHEGVFFFAMPLLAYQFAGGEFKTGLLFSFFALFGSLATVIIGKISDKTKKRLLFVKIGVAGAVPGMLIAGLADSMFIFIIGMAVFNFFIPMVWVFLMSQLGDLSRKRMGSAALTREFLLNGGRSLSVLLSMALLAYVGIGAIFAISSLFVLGILSVK